MDIEISTDPDRLDLDVIHRWLSEESYWAQGRPRELMQRSFDNSICFGAYLRGRQVGFARVVTDRATFAWLALWTFIIALLASLYPAWFAARLEPVEALHAV